jgi:hypothetical protein
VGKRIAPEEPLTPEALADYLRELPAGLRAWRSDRDLLYATLAWINTKATTDLIEGFVEMGPAALRMGPSLHNQAGIAVSWALTYQGTRSIAEQGSKSLDSMWSLTRRHWVLGGLLSEVRCRARGFEAGTRCVRLPFVGDRKLDCLDRFLDLMEESRGFEIEGRPNNAKMKPWLDAGGRDREWAEAPQSVRAHFRKSAGALIGHYPRYLPGDLDVGGFTMDEAASVLTEMLARAQLSQACIARGSTSARATLPFHRREELVADLGRETGVGLPAVDRLAGLLTADLDRCTDPCLTPIVPVGQALVPMCSLIAPGSPVRNLTALLQTDPGRFGAAGRAIGQLGVETCVETLSRVAGVRMASNTNLVAAGGRSLGDLDVTLVDAARRLIVVFEVTWQICADGSVEIGRAVRKTAEKRAQLAGYRARLAERTATAEWPGDWPDVSGFSKRWYVLTNDVLPLDQSDDDIVVRSHQMLAWMLRRDAALPELIALLDDPPTPPGDIAELQWTSLRYGKYLVEWDQVLV